jgi:transcriptional regulator with XRE-family HTH domain
MAEIGFNYRYYQKIESGEQNMNVATLSRLADALGVDISEFFRKV